MSTPEGRKSPKHERVTRATAAVTAAAAASKAPPQTAAAAASKAPPQTATAAASKAPAQTATATAPKALEEMASIAPEQTASKAKEEDSNDDSRVDRLETNIKVLQRTDSILIREISELKELITMLSRQVKALTF